MTNTYKHESFRSGPGNKHARRSRRIPNIHNVRGRKANGIATRDNCAIFKEHWDSAESRCKLHDRIHYVLSSERLFYLMDGVSSYVVPCVTSRVLSNYGYYRGVINRIVHYDIYKRNMEQDEDEYWFNGKRYLLNHYR